MVLKDRGRNNLLGPGEHTVLGMFSDKIKGIELKILMMTLANCCAC
jgi:hypothetical protein